MHEHQTQIIWLPFLSFRFTAIHRDSWFGITHDLVCRDIRVQKHNIFFQFGSIYKYWCYESTIPITICFLVFIAPNVVLIAHFFCKIYANIISRENAGHYHLSSIFYHLTSSTFLWSSISKGSAMS